MRKLLRARNFWIALVLLLFNGLAWLGTASGSTLPEVEPRVDPQLEDLREKLGSGDAAGESFRLVLTQEAAEQYIAWLLERKPEIPFSHPQVSIDPGGLSVKAVAHPLGFNTVVSGRLEVALRNGVLRPSIRELVVAGLDAPAVIRDEVEKQFRALETLPVEVTLLELGDGVLMVEGTLR